jgi:protein involved in polysaccharide export with SLBB domain
MKKSFTFRFLRLLIACLVAFPLTAFASSYRVGSGDELFVDFPLKGTTTDLQPLGGNGLTLVVVGNQVYFRYTVVVAPDGYITLPSMSPLRVDGSTIEQIQEIISLHMKSFPLHGDLSVILSRPNSHAFFVLGEAQKPGRYIYERPTSLLEAIGIAGGPTEHAKLNKVLLLRDGASPLSLDLSLKHMRRDGAPTLAIYPSDKIVIPRKWYTADNTILFYILSALGTTVAVYAATR